MKQDTELARVIRGILVALLLNMMAIIVFVCLFPFLIPFIGFVQLLYIIPYTFTLKKHGDFTTIKGLIIGIFLIALVNITAWIVFIMKYK